MATVFDVTNYILEKIGKMSTWKLQKLCYYSQAWHLAWTGKPIFGEEFEAWANGPVCVELFHAHQGKFVVDTDDPSPKAVYGADLNGSGGIWFSLVE